MTVRLRFANILQPARQLTTVQSAKWLPFCCLCVRRSKMNDSNVFCSCRTLCHHSTHSLFYSNCTNCVVVLMCSDLFNFPFLNTIAFICTSHVEYVHLDEFHLFCCSYQNRAKIENQMTIPFHFIICFAFTSTVH